MTEELIRKYVLDFAVYRRNRTIKIVSKCLPADYNFLFEISASELMLFVSEIGRLQSSTATHAGTTRYGSSAGKEQPLQGS